MGYRYQLTTDEEGRSDVSVFFTDGTILVADQDHPSYREIVAVLTAPRKAPEVLPTDSWRDQAAERLIAQREQEARDKRVRDLFDVTLAIGTKFESLSERVKVTAGRVFFDGVEVHNVLADQIMRFVKEGHDFAPLVKFYEKIATNPTPHSQENLYRWLVAQGSFTINDEGNIVAYKGLTADGKSITQGPGVVDGVSYNGHLPNHVGAVVEMPRDKVNHNPAQGCSVGLHAGTYAYARGFGQGKLAEVEVNPRDVVSVPTDSGDAKMRVCRYKVLKYVEVEQPTALYGREVAPVPDWKAGYSDDPDELDEELDDFEEELDDFEDDEVTVPVGTLRSVIGTLRRAVSR